MLLLVCSNGIGEDTILLTLSLSVRGRLGNGRSGCGHHGIGNAFGQDIETKYRDHNR